MARFAVGLLLALLLAMGQTVLAGPPERPSGRMVLDKTFEVRAEVRELEKEFARAKSDPDKGKWLAAQLAEARARLAETEGRGIAAIEEWRKVIEHRTERMKQMMSGKMYRRLREARAIDTDNVKDEHAVGEALRKAERRLEIVRRTLGPP